jgi:glucose-1-phosphate cytidylyltransferase
MRTVILCGGLGTRLSEETQLRPKPMVEIGGRPMLWHIMNIYAHYGHDQFLLALGYRGDVVKDYFLNYHARMSDVTVRLGRGAVEFDNPAAEDWQVTMADTGAETMTGGRIKRLGRYLRDHGTFMLTYGDGVADVDLNALLKLHRSHGRLATVTAVRPSARFGDLLIEGDAVARFREKPQTGEGTINGGFFVLEPEVLDYIDGDHTVFEQEPLENLCRDGQLMAYQHPGYWQCMDTLRDKNTLERQWSEGRAPWKVWQEPRDV